jgi:hypothetical protein
MITINEISVLKKNIYFEGMIHLTKELICDIEWGSFK